MIEMTEKNEITEYSQVEAGLQELRRKYGGIAIDVGTPKALDEAKRVRAAIREPRYECEKIRKALKAPALAYAKLIDTEAARITSELMAIETPWDEAIKFEEHRREVEKAAELQKERERIERHQAVIAQIRSYPGLARECRTAFMASMLITKLTDIDVSGLEEFAEQAQAAMNESRDVMVGIVDQKIAAEAEAARIKAEQEAEAARLAAERERLETERAEQARVQAEQQAELLAMQARMKAQQEELDRQAAAMAQQAAELAARKAEAEKPAEVLADDPREALGQIMGDALAGGTGIGQMTGGTFVRLDPSTVYAEPVLMQVPATVAEMHAIGEGIRNDPEPIDASPGQAPSAISLINVIAFEYGIEPAHAISWLAERADEFKQLNQIAEVTP